MTDSLVGYYSEIQIPWNEFTVSAQRAITNGIEQAQLEHSVLNNRHILFGVMNTEWPWLSFVMSKIGVDPESFWNEIKQKPNNEEIACPTPGGRHISPRTLQMFKMSKELTAIHKGDKIGVRYVLSAVFFDDKKGIGPEILNKLGVELSIFSRELAKIPIKPDYFNEEFVKRYKLPPHLDNFATNLNLLAVQDKLPPLFGREEEVMQVMEILCHKERPNSALLIGEPGVGKTAIAEGLARKIEFESRKMPNRLRGCHIINMAMNGLVAGTQLRGMFEERVQQVINEIKKKSSLYIVY